MSILVKICGLCDQQHIADAVAAGADALGFVFADSPRRITPADARALGAHVPAAVKRVAVMLHPSNDEWLAVLKGFAPDVLQTDAGDFARLEIPDGVERWPVYRQGGEAPMPAQAAHFVYEGRRSGQGETVDWSVAAGQTRRGQMILAGGLTPDNVAAAITTVRPYGVDASSGLESAPGQKESNLIIEFIRAAKAAEKTL